MRQLTAGELELSPRLQAADPAAVARWAAAARAGGEALRGLASTLEQLCAAMPNGLWRSPAAAEFVRAGREQVAGLGVVADCHTRLAGVAEGLASSLGQALERARAAVAAGRRADADVHEFNSRIRAQHALRPQDPDSLLAGGPEAQQLAARQAAAASELAGAEADASRAWQRAAAGFDLAGYATPAMRGRMAGGAWDPASAVRLVSGSAVAGCGPMDRLGLPSTGVLTGPDGRSYPLVVQTALDGDGKLLVTTREPADSGGWTPLAVRVGTTAYGPVASALEKLAVALGGAAGASYPDGAAFAPQLLGSVQIMAGGGAYLSDQPRSQPGAVKVAPAEPPRGKDHARYWTAPASGIAAGRKASVPDAVGLVNGALGGILAARHLDDGRSAGYRVVFEENAQGEPRARMQLFRVLKVPGEHPRVVAAGGYVDASGHLAGIPVTGEAPGTPPIMISAPR